MTRVQFGPQALGESHPVLIHFSAGFSLQNSRWRVVVAALDGRLRAQLERRKGMFTRYHVHFLLHVLLFWTENKPVPNTQKIMSWKSGLVPIPGKTDSSSKLVANWRANLPSRCCLDCCSPAKGSESFSGGSSPHRYFCPRPNVGWPSSTTEQVIQVWSLTQFFYQPRSGWVLWCCSLDLSHSSQSCFFFILLLI